MTTVIGVFMILHGLAHLWYVALSSRLVSFKPEMGWSGTSWLLSGPLGEGAARAIATILYSIGALGFAVGGVGLLMEWDWFRPAMIWSAVISVVSIVLFWDGRATQIVEKGLLGLVISMGVIIGVAIF